MEVTRLPDERARVLVRHPLRLPSASSRLRPGYDSGDHVHPNDAGYQATANATNLAAF
jgi:lysophospholipase L1-like esterase